KAWMSVPQTPTRCTRTRAWPAAGFSGGVVSVATSLPGASRTRVFIGGECGAGSGDDRVAVLGETAGEVVVVDGTEDFEHAGDVFELQRRLGVDDVFQHVVGTGRADERGRDARVAERILDREFHDIDADGLTVVHGLARDLDHARRGGVPG